MKYRQRGYRDSDRNDDRERRSDNRPPQSRNQNMDPQQRYQRRGLRHALDRNANEVVRCHVCGRSAQSAIGPETSCPSCNAMLHCCSTCTNFDSSARWQCRAPITAGISDKLKANKCDKYSPRLVLDATGKRTTPQRGTGSRPNDPKSQFENLFKN